MAIVFSIQVFGGTPLNEEKKAARRAIVGAWQINHAASDKLLDRTQFDFRQFPPPVSIAPEHLILAAGEAEGEITINEVFEKFINTKTLSPDADTTVETALPNESVSVKAEWRDKKLVVEITALNGSRTVETFESPSRNRLNVTTRIEDTGLAKPLTVRRVYERTTEEIPSEAAAEVNIADFLL